MIAVRWSNGRCSRAPCNLAASSFCRAPLNICRSTSAPRSEEHTSELQSHSDIVCRLLLEKKHNGGILREGCSGRSFLKQWQQQCQHHADDQAGHYGKVGRKVAPAQRKVALDHSVTDSHI